MINFYKYQGTGNDFVMIDNRSLFFPKKNLNLVEQICSRRFGIGADGLILIESHETEDFNMVYYNSDGSQSFCGNGARCAVRFASFLEMVTDQCTFEAIDGLHEAKFDKDNVSIKMSSVSQLEKNVFNDYILNTGSPHYVSFVEDLSVIDIVEAGRNIRYSPVYADDGVNVNVGSVVDGKINLLTYERGVEDETFSCGTGATAAVIAYAEMNRVSSGLIEVLVKGGTLKVKFEKADNVYDNIWLIGPAIESFRGTYG